MMKHRFLSLGSIPLRSSFSGGFSSKVRGVGAISVFLNLFLLFFQLSVAEEKPVAVLDAAKPEDLADVKGIKHPLKPMLWKVEKKGAKTSYLFGTIHLSDKRVVTLHPLAQKAFEKADCLYTEVNLSATGQLLASMQMVRKDGKTMKESLGKELVKGVNQELARINDKLTIEIFNTMKTWVIGVTLPMLEEQLSKKKALDQQLWERAEKAGKKLGALETLEEQMGQLDKLTEQEQVRYIKLTLEELKKDRKRKVPMMDQLVAAYLRGNEQGILKFFDQGQMGEDPELGKKFLSLLLDERNVRMAKNVEKFMGEAPDKIHFFAAGTAHYVGDKSVVSLLKKKGFKVSRVE